MNRELIEFTSYLADMAAGISLPAFTRGVRASLKADSSPVTEVDVAIEKTLVDAIRQRYPTHAILGEESGEHAGAEYRWIVDPIDGTRAFIAGVPTYATLIALEYQGAPVLGVADFPAMKKRFLGQGGVASCNDKPIAASKVDAFSDAVIATTSTYYFSPAQREAFDGLARKCLSYQLGGDAYPYMMLASGAVDIVIDVGVKYYDIAALLPVLSSAGAVVEVRENAGTYSIIAAATKELLASTLAAFPL